MFAWLLTYLIHSTVLLGLVWLVTRLRRIEPAVSELLWKVALVAGLVTGTVQARLQVSPPAALTLPAAALPTAGEVTVRSGESPVGPGTEATSTGPHHPAPPSTALRTPSLALFAVLLWGLIALSSSLYYVARRLILVGRLADRRPVTDGPLAATLADLLRTTGYPGRVRLSMARTISSPVALGTAEICVPELALSDLGVEQQRSMLAHELAHLARRDPLWLAGASLMERVFFLQPLNRVARRALETAAEYLSDEWATQKTGSAVSLAQCLATVAEWIQASPLGVSVAGLAERRSLLVSRVSRLLEERLPHKPAARRGWAAVAVLGVAATIAAAPRVSSPSTGPRSASVASPPGPLSVPERGNSGLAIRPPSPEGRGGQGVRTKPESGSGGEDTTVRRGGSGGADTTARREKGPVGEDTTVRTQVRQPGEDDTTVVAALIARLKDENAGVRSAAARSLGRLGDLRAVTPLIAVLSDSDAEVRSSAVEALAHLEDPRAIDPIVLLLKDPVRDVKRNALGALSHWEQGVPTAPVVALLDDGDADVRHEAVELLAHLHVRSAGPAIARLIHDPSADVRHVVVEALGNLGQQSSAAAVTEALGDPNADVRHAALDALNDLRAPIAEATLIQLMKDQSADVRQRVAELAGERSLVAAVPELRRLIADPRSDVREAATQALGHIADPAARQALQTALQSPDPKVRRAAAEALGEDR
ncbi:MAG TPA: M56 family metallopeptidase [Gemmatimonadales bacterium]|nr:M56 family metallopeptidase [Gemmatimonadales bacterium]